MNNIILKDLNIDFKNKNLIDNIFKYKDQDIENLKQEIKKIVKSFCLDNNINFDIQKYKISGYLTKSELNKDWYSLCSGKFFNFFGKYYLDYEVEEFFKNKNNESFNIKTNKNNLMLCFHHLYNKTTSDNNATYIEFYIAPSAFLEYFYTEDWTVL